MVHPLIAPRELVEYALGRLADGGVITLEGFIMEYGIGLTTADFYNITRRLLDRLAGLGVVRGFKWDGGFRVVVDKAHAPVTFLEPGVVVSFLHDVFTDSNNRVGDNTYLFSVRGLATWARARGFASGVGLLVIDHREFYNGLTRLLDMYKSFGMVSEYACDDAWSSIVPNARARCVIEVVGRPRVTPMGLGEYMDLVPRVLDSVVGIIRNGDSRVNIRNPASPILVTTRVVARRVGLELGPALDSIVDREVGWLLDSMVARGLIRGFRRTGIDKYLVFDN